MFVGDKNHGGGAGPSTPNDSQYFTGRFGLSKDSSVQQVNLSCKNTLTEDDLITSNLNQTDLQLQENDASSMGELEMQTANNYTDGGNQQIVEEEDSVESSPKVVSAALPKVTPFVS